METKFTKGEWTVDGFNTTSVITNINGYTKVCDCKLAGITGNDALQFLEENKANAKLIAAAPELLEALIQISESYKYCVKNAENSEFYINAINAINKATK